MIATMIVYLGFSRTTEVEVKPIDHGCGAGQVSCFECGGRGIWDYMVPLEPASDCVACKGTGKIYISI